VRFQAEELHGKGGEDVGFTVETWFDDLAYVVGSFVWDEKLPAEVKDIFKDNLLEKLRK